MKKFLKNVHCVLETARFPFKSRHVNHPSMTVSNFIFPFLSLKERNQKKEQKKKNPKVKMMKVKSS